MLCSVSVQSDTAPVCPQSEQCTRLMEHRRTEFYVNRSVAICSAVKLHEQALTSRAKFPTKIWNADAKFTDAVNKCYTGKQQQLAETFGHAQWQENEREILKNGILEEIKR